MKIKLVFLLCALAAGSAHAYTNAEDAVRGFNTCKAYENQTITLWKQRQEKGVQPAATAGKATLALRPINLKMDAVLAKDLSAYPHAEDAGQEVFSYCRDNLERLMGRVQARAQ